MVVHRPERRNSFQNHWDLAPEESASLPRPAASRYRALPPQLSFCRDRELNARNRRNLNLEKGWIRNKELLATLCPKRYPDPTVEPESPENALGTNFQTLPGPENHGSIPEIPLQLPFPMVRKTPALGPTAGTDLPVVLSVRAVQPESVDSDKCVSLGSRKLASNDTMPKQLRNQLLTLAGGRPA